MSVVPLPEDQGSSVGLGLVVGACLGAGTVRATRTPGLHQESQQPTCSHPEYCRRAPQLDSNCRAAAGRSGRRRQLEGLCFQRDVRPNSRPIPRLSHTTVSPDHNRALL